MKFLTVYLFVAMLLFMNRGIAESVETEPKVSAEQDWQKLERKGDLLQQDGKIKEAIKVYRRALLDDENSGVELSMKLALLLENSGQIDEAIVALREVLLRSPGNLTALDRLAKLYMQRTSYNQAIEILKAITADLADEPEYRLMMGTAYFQVRDFPLATAAFKSVLEMEPGNRNAVISLAGLYRYQGKHELAANLYREYLKEDIEDRDIQKQLLNTLIKLKKVDQELIDLIEAELKLEPNANSYYRLGVVHSLLRHHDQADKAYKKALEIEPNHTKSLMALGKIHLLKREYTVAKRYFEQVNQTAPDSEEPDNYIEQIRLLTTPVEKPKAIKGTKITPTVKKMKKTASKSKKAVVKTPVVAGGRKP